ncbi:MAG TPA: 3-hydroxybutyrate dehydrogenase [Myxococcales bacterium]|jgi:3-hydroxybutyrate dehydrogenase|nr:3-hydroxybutyrate dehydrogenase [Myxococcales bacterium]
MKLQGKVAIVTGAASGIGRAIAEKYLANGARVAVADVRGAEEAAKALGPNALGVAMDVTDEKQVDDGVAQVAKRLGGVDVLVSNAGVQHISALVDLELRDWRRMLAIHLDGAFLTTRACLRQMASQKRGGAIIYMGSVHSKEASPLKAPYVAAKHGLVGLCKSVAKEGAPIGVRSNVICPGFVRTPLVEKQIPEQARDLGITEAEVIKNVMLKNTVDGEFTTLDDVAEVALFFAAFPSNALTGQSVIVSHGWHME